MINEKIILVTDKNEKILNADISNRNLEGNSSATTKMISNAIKEVASDFEIYTDVQRFLYDISKFNYDLIFPMKYGYNAPDSKSIIPGICEGANIRYIGADDYAHIICNDKYLAKLYAKDFNIKTAASLLFREPMNRNIIIEQLKILQLPLVVKPNYGGGSTGISHSNICFEYETAANLLMNLFNYHNMPILVEEYIPGQEVELILVGTNKQITFSKEVQLIMDNKEYFNSEIWGFETKKIDDSNIDFKMSSFLSKSDITKLHTLFKSFDKIEFMRIDGRIYNGEFYLIELSPDCYLGDDCAFFFAFENEGYTLSEMFEYIIHNSLNHYQL